MKNISLTALAILSLSTAQADYKVVVPLEISNSGVLENGSIKFSDSQNESWSKITPLTSDWSNTGKPSNCTNWSPEPSTVNIDESFTQTATDCEQEQTRTVQEREQETTSLAIRNVGSPTSEYRTTVGTDTRDSKGTMEGWEAFADARKLSKQWNDLPWYTSDLTEIPYVPYPQTTADYIYLSGNQLANVNGFKNLTSVNYLYLNDNQLTNIDGLRNLTSVNTLYLYQNKLSNVDALINLTSVQTLNIGENQLTNVNGLRNLTSVGQLSLNDNQLTNLDGLSNLTSVNNLYLNENKLTNLDGLRNIQLGQNIWLSGSYSGPKLAASTRFCTLNDESKFDFMKKSQICE